MARWWRSSGRLPRGEGARKLRQDVFLAEIDLEKLHARGLRTVEFAPLAKYPAVERDFSFVFADEVEFEAMRRAVMGLAPARVA